MKALPLLLLTLMSFNTLFAQVFNFDNDVSVAPQWVAENANTQLSLVARPEGGKRLMVTGNGVEAAGRVSYVFDTPISIASTPQMKIKVETTKKASNFTIILEDADGSITDVQPYQVYLEANHETELLISFYYRTNSNTGSIPNVDLNNIKKIGIQWSQTANLNGNVYIDDLKFGQNAGVSIVKQYSYNAQSGVLPLDWISYRNQGTMAISTSGSGVSEVQYSANLSNEERGIEIRLIDHLNLSEGQGLRFRARAAPQTDAFTVRLKDVNGRVSDWINISLHEHENKYAIDIDSIVTDRYFRKDWVAEIQLWPHHYEAYTGNIYISTIEISNAAKPKTLKTYYEDFNKPTMPFNWISDARHHLRIDNNKMQIDVNKTDEDHYLEIDFAERYDISENPYVKFKASSVGSSIEYNPVEVMTVTLKDEMGNINNYPTELISYKTTENETELLYSFVDKLRYDVAHNIDLSKIKGVRMEMDRSRIWKGTFTIDDFKMGEAAAPEKIDSYTQLFDEEVLPYYWLPTDNIDLSIATEGDNKMLKMDVNTDSKLDFIPLYFSKVVDIETYPYISFTASSTVDIEQFAISLFNINKPAIAVLQQSVNNERSTYFFDLKEMLTGVDASRIGGLKIYPDKTKPLSTQLFIDDFKIGKAAMTDEVAVQRASEQLTIEYLNRNYDNDEPLIIKNDVVLTNIGVEETSVGWISTNENFIGNGGIVKQPTFTEGDVTVTLIADISRGEAKLLKVFNLIVSSLSITNNEKIAIAQTVVPNQLSVVEGVDANIIEMLQAVINSNADLEGVVVEMAANGASNHNCIEGNGVIDYNDETTADVFIRIKSGATNIVKTISVYTPEKAALSIPYVIDKLASSYDVVEGRDDNILNFFSNIVDNIKAGIVVELQSENANNITADGGITYRAKETAIVHFNLSKGLLQDDVSVTINIPSGHLYNIDRAIAVLPSVLHPDETIDTNILDMVAAITSDVSDGVQLSIKDSETNTHSNIAHSGTITYNTAKEQELTLLLSRGGLEKEFLLHVDLPKSINEVALDEAIAIFPETLHPVENTDNNIIDMLANILQSEFPAIDIAIDKSSIADLPQLTENGFITYNEARESTIDFILTNNDAVRKVGLSVYFPIGKEEKEVSDAKSVIPVILYPSEQLHSNILDLARVFVDAVSHDVQLSIIDIENKNIAADGTISYGFTSEDGQLTFVFQKGETVKQKTVTVVVEASGDRATLTTAVASIPQTFIADIHEDTNLLSMIKEYTNAIDAEIAVSIDIAYGASSDIVNEDGALIYSEELAVAEVRLILSLGNVQEIIVRTFNLNPVNIENEQNDAIQVYPNPASDILCIEGENIESIRLISVDGGVVKEFSNLKKAIDVSTFKSGTYILQLGFSNKTQYQHIIIIK